jgi:hypothetical protein
MAGVRAYINAKRSAHYNRELTVTRILTALLLAIAVLFPAMADARVVVGVGVGVAPWPYYYPYYPPAYYYGPAYYPPPVYVAPPVYAPPVTYTAPAAATQTRYYCDDPQGYYPSVPNCNRAWREVGPAPAK